MRVFCIQGHGASCTITDYKQKNRLKTKGTLGELKGNGGYL